MPDSTPTDSAIHRLNPFAAIVRFYRGARTLENGNGKKPVLMLPPAPITSPSLRTVATILGVLVLLHVARELLIPLALAAFVALLLHPLVERLKAAKFTNAAAVVLVSILALIPVTAIGWLVFRQFMNVFTTLPEYTENIKLKLDAMQGPMGLGFERFAEMLKQLQEGQGGEAPAQPPLPVSVVEPPPDTLTTVREYLGPILSPLATIGITLVFAMFMLFQWDDLRDRLIRLVSGGRMTTTTGALDELSARIGKFLRMQFIVNALDGVCIGLGLYFLGVPNALLWGFLSAVLRYIPYLGAITAATLPFALSIATAEGWGQPLNVLIFLVTFEVISNNFIEPYMYGSSTGISALALLLAAIFWGWLWGIPGMLLATPLTTCLVVAGRHVPQLSFLSVMLGDQPVLEPPVKFYQRLVAMDGEEANDVAMAYLDDHSLPELFDDVLLPALKHADTELEQGKLDKTHYDFILKVTAEVVEDAAIKAAQIEVKRQAEASPQTPPSEGGVAAGDVEGRGGLKRPRLAVAEERLRVLCLPARDEADSIAGSMVEVLGHDLGVGVRWLQVEELGTDLAAVVKEYNPDLVLVSSVPPHAGTHARARAKIARRRVPHLRFIGGVWGLGPDAALRGRLEAAGFEGVVGSMAEVLKFLDGAVPKVMAEGEGASPVGSAADDLTDGRDGETRPGRASA